MTPAARQPRRPLLALFAGLLLPGLGHVYAGDPARGTGWLLSVALPVPAAAWLALHGPRALMSLLMLAGVTTAFACYVASIEVGLSADTFAQHVPTRAMEPRPRLSRLLRPGSPAGS